jgi:hypothetical protein
MQIQTIIYDMVSNLKKINSYLLTVWPEAILILFFQYFIFFYNKTYYLKIIDWLDQFIVQKEIKRQYFNFFNLDLIIPNFLNGLKYNYLVPSEFHFTTISEFILGVYTSEFLIDLLGKVIIFIISTKALNTISNNLSASIVAASFISFSDYWPNTTLTILTLIISINIFIQSKDKVITNFQIFQILILPFLFEVQLGGIFIFIFSYIFVYSKLGLNKKFYIFTFLNFITMILPNYRLFYEIIFVKTNVRSFTGNVINLEQFNEFIVQIIKTNSDGHHHYLTSNHRYLFLIIYFYLFYLIYKKLFYKTLFSKNEKFFIKIFFLIQVFNILHALDHSRLLNFNALFSTRLHLYRISIFNQFLWGLLLCLILSKINRRSLNIVLLLLSFTLSGSAMHKLATPETFSNLSPPLNEIAVNFGQRVNYVDYTVMNIFNSLLPEQSTYGTFYSTLDEYYFKEDFENLKKDLTNEITEYRFVSYDIDPMIAAYSGLYTIDGYFNLYENEYRAKFRKVIEKELDYLGDKAIWYDDYGAKVQLFFKEKYGSYNLENINFCELKNFQTTHFISIQEIDYKYLNLFKKYENFIIYEIKYFDC